MLKMVKFSTVDKQFVRMSHVFLISIKEFSTGYMMSDNMINFTCTKLVELSVQGDFCNFLWD